MADIGEAHDAQQIQNNIVRVDGQRSAYVPILKQGPYLIATIQASLTNVNSALAKLSAGAKKFSIQATFSQKLSDTLTAGIGHLVDADMAKESAKLQALQTKQQLGVQALSIANQSSSSLLGLFR